MELRYVRAILIFFLSLLSCSSLQFNIRKEEKGVRVDLRLIWQKRLVKKYRSVYSPYEGSKATISKRFEQIFIGSSNKYLYNISLKTGKVNWRFKTEGAVRSEPLLLEESSLLIFGDDEGILYCLRIDKDSYKKLWSISLGYEIRQKPLFSEDTLFVKNENDELFSINLKDGKILWHYKLKRRPEVTTTISSGILSVGDQLITGFSDGSVISFNKFTGDINWKVELSSYVKRRFSFITSKFNQPMFDIATTPVLVDDTVWVASIEAGLVSIDPDSGELLWRRGGIKRITSITKDGGFLYLIKAGYGVICMNREGVILWKKKLEPGLFTKPEIYKGLLIISNRTGSLWILKKIDGKILLKLFSSYGFSPPKLFKNHLIVLGERGTLMNFQLIF